MSFDDPADPTTNYIKAVLIVDDILVATKGEITIEIFDKHVEKMWALKKFAGVDGFLNNNCYFNVDLNTITICMDVRITEIMKEHLPDKMLKEAGFYPKTPNHPDMMKLQLGLAALSPALAKSSLCLGCQLMYVVVQRSTIPRSSTSSIRRASARGRAFFTGSAFSTLYVISTRRGI